MVVGLGFVASSLDALVRAEGFPTLRIESPSWSAVAGDGSPEVGLEASTFEIFRAFGGRRSEAQFRAMSWTGDPAPYVRVFDRSPLQLRDEPLVE